MKKKTSNINMTGLMDMLYLTIKKINVLYRPQIKIYESHFNIM